MYKSLYKLCFIVLSLVIMCSCANSAASTPSPGVVTPDSVPTQASAPAVSASPEATIPAETPSEAPLEVSPSIPPTESIPPSPSTVMLTGALTMDDLAIAIDGQVYKLNENAAPMLAAMGDDYEFSQDVSCVFDGYDKVHTYDSIEITTYPDGENDIIDQFVLFDAKYETMRGIKVGATKAEIEAAYGDGYFMDGPFMTYTISGDQADIESPRCYFELDESEVAMRIFIHYPTVQN